MLVLVSVSQALLCLAVKVGFVALPGLGPGFQLAAI